MFHGACRMVGFRPSATARPLLAPRRRQGVRMSTARTIPVWAPIGDATSDWSETLPPAGAVHDVVVVGAGIAGLTTAACLLREGRQVLVVDREGVGAGETLRTTAHLASALDDRFTLLQRHHGKDGARLAAASHAVAIDWIEDLAAGVPDCGFRRVPGYLYSHTGEEQGLRREMEAARESGLEVHWCEAGEALPARFGPAIRFAAQARIDAGAYMLALAGEVSSIGRLSRSRWNTACTLVSKVRRHSSRVMSSKLSK